MTYEKPILAALLSRANYDRYGKLFKPEFFDLLGYRFVFESIEEYWSNVNGDVEFIPNDIFLSYVLTRDSGRHDDGVLDRLVTGLYDRIPGEEEVSPLVRKALDQKELTTTLQEATQEITNNKLDLDQLILTLQNHSKNFDRPEKDPDPLNDLESIIAYEKDTAKYSTGLPTLDAELNGGLWAGEIGVVIAPPHRGKTLDLVGKGAAHLRNGQDVLHFTCEISRSRTAIRYYQNLLETWRETILEDARLAQERLSQLNLGKLLIKDYSSIKPSTGKIRHDVMRFRDEGATHPLIIIDYLDHVHPTRRHNENRFALKAAIEEIRQLANELELGIWTASQANRSSYQSNHIGLENVAESVAKVEVADVVISLNQNDEEFRSDTMRIYINKARERMVEVKEIPVRVVKQYQKLEELI